MCGIVLSLRHRMAPSKYRNTVHKNIIGIQHPFSTAVQIKIHKQLDRFSYKETERNHRTAQNIYRHAKHTAPKHMYLLKRITN